MKKLLLVLFLLPTIVFGRKFYFSSSTGNDSYTITQAQSQSTPWQTLQKLERMSRTVGGFQAGDTICFKRGDVFANGFVNGYASVQWVNDGGTYWIGASGTPTNPIVITNYGSTTLPLPNWLYPSATYPVSSWPYTREGRSVIKFGGVHDIIIDGIQSNDYRIPESDKSNPGYSGGWILGEWTKGTSGGLRNSYVDSTRRQYMVTRMTVKNCVFNNIIYGIYGLAGIDCKITNNTFTNFKSSADTAGTNDVMAGALEAINGIRCEISHNYIKGAWAKSGRISSTWGLGGVAFDMFNLYNSKICYNTIIDCSGAFEIGNLDRYDSLAGFQYDTIAFNKIINTGQFGYFHGTGFFAGNNHHISIWNNDLILNNKDRMGGVGFGQDVYNDGQGWAPGTSNPWWFCRNAYSTFNPPNYPLKPTVNTTQGSNIITVSSSAGITVGSVWFTDNDALASKAYKTVTVTNVSGNTLTLSDTATRTVTGYVCNDESGFYLPVSDQTWSNPQNPPYNNWSATRSILSYSTDATIYGSYIDTMFDVRNNIYYWTNGEQGLYDRNRYKRSANIYYYKGAARYATSLGGTLNYRGTKERAMTSGLLFKDTSNSVYPENWDLHLNDTSYAKTNGVAISGFTTDFDGNSIVGVTPFIGIYKPTSAVVPTIVVTPSAPSTTLTCYGDVTTVTVSATGGTAPYTGTGVFTRGAGFHSFTVADANGYTGTSNITIIQPSDISGSVSFTPITSAGGTTTVSMSASGGTGIKTYSLDGGAYQSGTSFTNVSSGIHMISVKDASGCTHDFYFEVTYNSSVIKARLKFKN